MPDSNEDHGWDSSPKKRPYHRISLPVEKPKEDWDVNERRAYILDRILEEYHIPKKVPRVDIAKEFDVDHSLISRDVDIIKGYMANYLGQDFEAEVSSLMRSSMYELEENGEYYKAVQVADKWSEWLESRGEVEDESPDEDINITVSSVEERESED